MRQQLVETDQGTALLITPEVMLALGIENEVELTIERDHAVLRKPITMAEASCQSDVKFAEAYRELAK